MYFIYKSVASWDGNAIASDIFKILSNDLNISGYSASCDKVNTQVLANSTPGGWEAWDAAAGANTWVIKSTEANGVNAKYIRIYGQTSGSSWPGPGPVGFNSATYWNNVTHTGTNVSSNDNYVGYQVQRSSLWSIATQNSNPVTIMIWQTAAYIIFLTGYSGSWNAPIIIGAELDRNTTVSDYYSGTTNSATLAGLKFGNDSGGTGIFYGPGANTTATYQTPGNNSCCVVPILQGVSTNTISGNPSRNIDESYGPLVVIPAHVLTSYYGSSDRTIYGLSGIAKNILVLITATQANPLDELVLSGTTYSIIKSSGAGSALLVPKS